MQQAREKLGPKMDQLKQEWNTTIDKFHASLQSHTESARAELKKLQADSARSARRGQAEARGRRSRSSRKTLAATRDKLHASLKSRMESTQAALSRLEADAAKATGQAKAWIQTQIDALKASRNDDLETRKSSEPSQA